jgi:hypothetical protein
LNDKSFLQSHLYPSRMAYNTEKFSNDYIYQSSKMWCNSERDYCPLVISLISIVIFITLLLIIYMCVNSFELRRFFQSIREKLFNNSSQSSFNNNMQRRNNIETLNALRNPNISSSSRSAFRRISNQLNASDRNIWFTGRANYTKQTQLPPPPTYEETIESIRASKTDIVHKLHTVPVTQSASVNNAFSIENINSQESSPVFPTYRCLALTTSPSTRAQLQRLRNMSIRLLQENRFNEETTRALARVGTLQLNNDEVPPSYETVIKSTQNLNQSYSNEVLI